jgi:hypothetical protein
MNLTWHIIKKDLRRGWVGLLILAVLGIYMTLTPSSPGGASEWEGYLKFFCFVLYVAVSLTLIPAFIQEDGVEESDVFWRTLPISPGRMLGAKLILLGVVFVLVPVAMRALHFAWFDVPEAFRYSHLKVTFIHGCIVLGCAALASITKETGRYFMVGLLCLLATGALGSFFTSIGPSVRRIGRAVGEEKMLMMLAYGAVLAALVLYFQYFKRWKWISVGLVAFAVVGAALIGSYWSIAF